MLRDSKLPMADGACDGDSENEIFLYANLAQQKTQNKQQGQMLFIKLLKEIYDR